MPDINLGDNYSLDEDSNGNLVIKDNSGNAVLKHDHANNAWESVKSFSTDESVSKVYEDEWGGSIQGLDPSLTHVKWVSLTIDELFSTNWIADHRNPVQATKISRSHNDDGSGVTQGHVIGDSDPVVINGNLHTFGEGVNSVHDIEDIHYQAFEDAGMRVKTPIRFIGNGPAEEQRVAPVVKFVPEQGGYVMFHSANETVENWDRNFGISTSADLHDWTRITGADPLIDNVSPHFAVVREHDTFYVFVDDRKETENEGYFEIDANDLTSVSSYQPITLPDRQNGLTPTICRCKDGYILINCRWSDIEVWETTFEDFPHGWENRRVNPFGFEYSATWDQYGYRNVSVTEVNGTPTVVAPGTDVDSSQNQTGNSENGFFRANQNSEMEWQTQTLPESLYPRADITWSTNSWAPITHPNGENCTTELMLDPVSAREVYLQGHLGVLFNNSTSDTVYVRLYDADASTTLMEWTSDDSTFKVYNVGPFDIENENQPFGSHQLRLDGKVDGGEGRLQSNKRAGLRINYPIGRLPE